MSSDKEQLNEKGLPRFMKRGKNRSGLSSIVQAEGGGSPRTKQGLVAFFMKSIVDKPEKTARTILGEGGTNIFGNWGVRMCQHGRRDEYEGARWEFNHQAKLPENKVATISGWKGKWDASSATQQRPKHVISLGEVPTCRMFD